jgi:hypothetical protein
VENGKVKDCLLKPSPSKSSLTSGGAGQETGEVDVKRCADVDVGQFPAGAEVVDGFVVDAQARWSLPRRYEHGRAAL